MGMVSVVAPEGAVCSFCDRAFDKGAEAVQSSRNGDLVGKGCCPRMADALLNVFPLRWEKRGLHAVIRHQSGSYSIYVRDGLDNKSERAYRYVLSRKQAREIVARNGWVLHRNWSDQ